MAILIRGIRDGIEFEGFELDYILDEELDLGEVYLDENLVYQSTEVFTEGQLIQSFKREFKISDIADDLVGIKESQIDYNIDGIATGLFTRGGEYMTQKGTEYVGDYHVHPDGIVMQGKFMTATETTDTMQFAILEPIDDEDLVTVRENGITHNIDYTVDADLYSHLGADKEPIDLTDEELLEEQRREENVRRFGILEDDDSISDDPDRIRERRDLPDDYVINPNRTTK